ncbi:hypothetical protein [Sinorhizobium meliloti]|nr:hypothetical protein [Sinorhizobium meliloti]
MNSKLARLLFASVSCSVLFHSAERAYALPELDIQKSVVVDGVTVNFVPDSSDPNLYYYRPDNLELSKDGAGNLRFGFHHWGITNTEPTRGTGGNITFTIQPSWNRDLIAKATVELKKANPQAILAVIPVEKSYFDVIMANSFVSDATYITPPPLLGSYEIKYAQALKDMGIAVDKNNLGEQPKTVLESVSGAGGTESQAFTIDLNDLGGRLSVSTPGEKSQANYLGVRYRYLVKGVTPKFRAELKVNWKKTFEHFHASFGGGYWFWSASQVIDIQSMKQDGAIELTIVEGAVDEKSETLINSVFESLVNARINGTGMFAPQLKPSELGGGGGGGASGFGWSFNASSSFQKLTEEVNQTFIIDKQDITQRAFSVGASFGLLCKPGNTSDYFVNLSQPSKPCPSDADIADMLIRISNCWTNHREQLEFAKNQSENVRKAIEEQVIRICSGPKGVNLANYFSVN